MEQGIKIVENGIYVDIEKLKKIITHEWPKLLRDFYKLGYRGEELYFSVLHEIEDYADGLSWETRRIAQARLGISDIHLDREDLYPKSDIRSIGFEVLSFLEFITPHGPDGIAFLITEDIPFILEFIDTPAGKSLEAWDRWERYWEGLDYPARRKKLLEDPKYNYKTPFYVELNTKSQGGIEEAQNLLYKLIKEFAPKKKLVAEGNKIVRNGELRIFYRYEENLENLYIEVRGPNIFLDVEPDNLVHLEEAIKEAIEEQKRKFGNPVHPRAIRDIIRNS